MSSPIPSAPGDDRAAIPAEAAAVQSASVVALSGLLKVQRRWLLASRPGSEPGPAPETGGRRRLPVHLEDSEWSRLALGVTADALMSLGLPPAAQMLELGPDAVVVHLPTSQPAPWPFEPGGTPQSWALPRDTGMIASLSVTPAILSASRKAALATLSEADGRRALVDLVSVGSTILKGPVADVGVKIADLAVELGTRRWSDLGTLVLVGFDGGVPRLEGTTHVPDVAAALDELTVRSLNGTAFTSICVIVPPWACDPADPLLGELVGSCEVTAGAGVLSCASPEGALCLWELASDATGPPALVFGDGRRLPALDPIRLAGASRTAPGRLPLAPAPLSAEPSAHTAAPSPKAAASPIEVAVLGNVQVTGAPETFNKRRRLTELVAFLAMHPEGATTDSFATALWPERRVPMQTLANRLSETRRALGPASDGRPRLRKQGKRHLIVETGTDWDRFRELSSEGSGADSWRRALALVRGRPFDGLDRGEWAQLEGLVAAIEATVVDLACRLGDHSMGNGKPDLAHWAARQGLLVSPWDERLYRLQMRAADALGNRGGVDAALRSLSLALELEGDPLLGIHPETSALYRSLTSGPG